MNFVDLIGLGHKNAKIGLVKSMETTKHTKYTKTSTDFLLVPTQERGNEGKNPQRLGPDLGWIWPV